MKILFVNKFLHPNGGSETYIFEIGNQLIKMGHEVQYFGMEHEGRIVGNQVESYISDMDFHTGKLKKLVYPFKIIYSLEARRKIHEVLEVFKPDIIHLNNINFQITPSILYEIRQFEKKNKYHIKIVATAHDYQWICPNHMLYIPSVQKVCEKCTHGQYRYCTKYRCIHNSFIKSILATIESRFYHSKKTYDWVDTILCPSEFLYQQFQKDDIMKNKLIMRHNFVIQPDNLDIILSYEKKEYVLYFGRYSKEKGIHTLLNVCKELPQIQFVFAGSGPLEDEINKIQNIKNVGFKQGKELQILIRQAQFSIYPSEWYENCPFSVMESQMYGTPVIGADIGGIPELLQNEKTGELFQSGNHDELKQKVSHLWNDRLLCHQYQEHCKENTFESLSSYCDYLDKLYGE